MITLLFLSGIMGTTSAQALTLTNCNSKINYPAPINSGIAFHGTAMYEILAVLNIHDRANSMSGINRNSLQYRAWYSARLGQKNLSSFRLKRNVLDHINRLKFLNIRYPSVTDLIGRKTKFYLAGYYQGIYPKTARKLRTNLHGRKIFTFINSISCKSAFDKSYKATFEDLFTDMLAIGKLTGRQKQAQDLVTQYQARLRAVANKLAGKKPKRIFYFEGGLKTPYGPRAGSIETIILEKAGAENIAITDPERPALRWATLRREKPDHVIIPFDGNQDLLLYKRKIIEENFSDSRAISNIIPIFQGDWQISPAAIDAVEHLARTLYPEIFAGK